MNSAIEFIPLFHAVNITNGLLLKQIKKRHGIRGKIQTLVQTCAILLLVLHDIINPLCVFTVNKQYRFAHLAERPEMNSLFDLRPAERNYKDFFLTTGYSTLDHAIDMKTFRDTISGKDPRFLNSIDLLPSIEYTEALHENQYFFVQQDITAVQHLRYMPAVLHDHEFFELACVLNGTLTNYIGDLRMELNEGDVIIISPHNHHAVCAYSDDAIMVNILVRASTFEQHFLNLLPKSDILYDFFVKTLYVPSKSPYLLFPTGGDTQISKCVRQLLEENQRNRRYKNTMLASLLSEFFVTLMRRHEKDVVIPGISASLLNENTLFIIEYMQNNYSTISLSHLASFFNYSERQVARIIKNTTGMSFGDNILRIRMDRSKEMLAIPSMTVSEIADVTGYYDVSSFRHAFKSYWHQTPQEYRESLKIHA